ncbi:MAG: DUF748 domain-containing protein [Rubrivivax sp.]|nr:DUF748 domain-containing protein [Rubrivivax sp.]
MRTRLARVAVIIAAVAAALVALVLLAAWLLPDIARRQIEQRGTAALGRAVQLERVEIDPWRLAVSLHGLRVAAADPSAPPQLAVARIALDVGIASLWHLAPVVEALQIDAPHVRLARTAPGRYDIDDVLARFAAAPVSPPSDEPARYALFNVEVRDGRVDVDDRPVQRQHAVTGLHIGLPFLSNLPEDVLVKVEPRLEMTLDDGALALRGQALPFAPDRATQLELTLQPTPLGRWWAYLPAGLPLVPEGGRVTTTLNVRFSQPPREVPRLAISGSLTLDDLALRRPDGTPMLAWQSASLQFRELRPLERKLAFGPLVLQGLQADVRRDAAGRIDWAMLSTPEAAAAPAAAPAASAASAASPAASATSGAGSTTAAPPGWAVEVDRLELQRAAVRWADATVGAAYALQALDLRLDALRWPAGAPSAATASATLLAAGREAGQLAVQGTVSPAAAKLELRLQALPLAAAAPYLRPLLVPKVEGRLGAQATLAWRGGAGGNLEIQAGSIELDALRLLPPDAREPAVTLARLKAEGIDANLAERRATLTRLQLVRPVVRLRRDAQGQLDAQGWVVAEPTPAARPPERMPAPAAPVSSPPWRAALRELKLAGGRLRLEDDAVRPGSTQTLRIADLMASAQGLQWPAAAEPVRWQVSARVPAPRGGDDAPMPDGRIDARGQAVLQPLDVRAALLVERLPVHAAEPWFGDLLPYRLARAELGWRGDVQAAQGSDGWRATARGALRVADLQLRTRPFEGADFSAGDQALLSWNALDAQPLAVSVVPGRAPVVDVGELAISDFYSQLVITEQGRFNLRDTGPAAPAAAASAPPVQPAVAAASAAASAPAGEFPVALTIGRTRLTNGRIDFRDRFVRPSYAAALTDLEGGIGRLTSGTREMAPIELRGRVAGTGLLDIRGALNPTATPLALDLAARATDLELAPLSPYSGKYAGYAIERGKLSLDVAYKIDADGRLEARNQLVLNQLTLGAKIDSPEATKLPVRLALALLTDRHGNIDIDLPISGSINDPQFSIFGLVMKIIGNLLVKALTAPFSLLAGGGSEEMSSVEFLAGTARLAPSAAPVLQRIGRALADRPALQLTMQGSADGRGEAEAMKAALLEARLAALWQREQARAARPGAAASGPAAAPQGADRLRMLERLYADTPLPDKPRNLLGMAKAVPAPEMEARLKAAMVLPADAARELALQRGLAVRDALMAQGLPAARLFLAAPQLVEETAANGPPAAEGSAGPWKPSVRLSLGSP